MSDEARKWSEKSQTAQGQWLLGLQQQAQKARGATHTKYLEREWLAYLASLPETDPPSMSL